MSYFKLALAPVLANPFLVEDLLLLIRQHTGRFFQKLTWYWSDKVEDPDVDLLTIMSVLETPLDILDGRLLEVALFAVFRRGRR
jgi:hypothetical protein